MVSSALTIWDKVSPWTWDCAKNSKLFFFPMFYVGLWGFEEPTSRTPSNIQDLVWCDLTRT
jgi:hypothetical protein